MPMRESGPGSTRGKDRAALLAASLVLAAALLGAGGCSNSQPSSPGGSKTSGSSDGAAPTATTSPTATPAFTYPYGNTFGVTTGTPGTGGDFVQAMGIAVDSDGRYIAVSDPSFQNIQVFAQSNGSFLYEIDSTNSGATITAPNQPYGMAFAPGNGDDLYVADLANAEVDVYHLTETGGTWEGYYVGGGSITGPQDVKFDNEGNLVVADYNSGYTYNVDFDNDSVLATSSGDGGGISPAGVAVDSLGNLYVADQANDFVICYGPDYQFHYAFNGGPGDGGWPGALGFPQGVLVDSQGNLVVADPGNGQVVRTNVYGVYYQNIGTGYITSPTYMGLGRADTNSGDLYVVDQSLGQFLEFLTQ
jgi:tripartite motif-containing protein 71